MDELVWEAPPLFCVITSRYWNGDWWEEERIVDTKLGVDDAIEEAQNLDEEFEYEKFCVLFPGRTPIARVIS